MIESITRQAWWWLVAGIIALSAAALAAGLITGEQWISLCLYTLGICVAGDAVPAVGRAAAEASVARSRAEEAKTQAGKEASS